MKGINCLFMLLVVMAIMNCCVAADKTSASGQTDEQVVVQGNNKFALALWAKLRVREGNLFFSPYSISTALAMTYAGARGPTEAQMARVLHFPTSPNKETAPPTAWEAMRFHTTYGRLIKQFNSRGQKHTYELVVANALWGQKGYEFLTGFAELINDKYGGELNAVDFVTDPETARQTINAWVGKKTKDKIKDLIARGVLDQMTRLVLTNAIYFKGTWARQFNKDKTKESPFTLVGGQKVDVEMMNQTALFGYMETEDFQGLEMLYADGDLSMIIFLPKRIDGLADFEKTLTAERLSRWLARFSKREVIVSIPKFKMTSQFSLSSVLKSMGMTTAFVPGVADFSGMNGKRDLFISAVIHKAYVEVNEEGTEAAAATAVTMKITIAEPLPMPVFRADHPFLFLIRDNRSGSILFIGRVANPKS